MPASTPFAPSGQDAPTTDRALIAVPLLFAAVVWAPILGNYFFGDDLLNLYSIVNKGLLEYLITPYGGHILATRNAIYALCFHLFGTDVRWYFLLVLLTHLVNVALLFRVIEVLTESPRLACLGATLWGTSPVNEGALGWYSVYGHVLAATIFLWLFWRLCQIGAGRPPGRLVPWSWALLLLAASTSFGIGIAVTLVFPLVALLMLPPGRQRRRLVAVLSVVALLVVALYFGLHRLAGQLYLSPAAGAFRLNMLLGNLQYGPRIALVVLHMIGFGISNLLLGPFADWAPYGGPVSALVLAIFALALVAVLLRGSSRVRQRVLACLLVSSACYAIIAAGRLSFFNASRDLVVQALRYHYLPPLPFTVALCLMLSQAQAWRRLPRRLCDAALALWLVALAIGVVASDRQIDSHLAARRFTEQTLAELQDRIDSAPPGQDVYIENRRFLGVGPMLVNNPKIFPGSVAVFTVFYPSNTVAGRRIFFVVEDSAVRDAGSRGKRTATLLVPPPDR